MQGAAKPDFCRPLRLVSPIGVSTHVNVGPYFTLVAECSIRRKRTSGSSLPKWPRPSDPNGFHRHPSDQPPARLHFELLRPFCKVSQPVLWLRTPHHCLRDTQPTTKPGLSLEPTEQERRGISE